MGEDGKPAKPGLIPTLDESIENKTILLGTPEQVAEGIQFYRDLLGVEHLTIFPHLLGDSYKKADEQMARFIEEVVPLVQLTRHVRDRLGSSSATSIVDSRRRRRAWSTTIEACRVRRRGRHVPDVGRSCADRASGDGAPMGGRQPARRGHVGASRTRPRSARSVEDLGTYFREGLDGLVDRAPRGTRRPARRWCSSTTRRRRSCSGRAARRTRRRSTWSMRSAPRRARCRRTAEAAIDSDVALDGIDELLCGFFTRGRSKIFDGHRVRRRRGADRFGPAVDGARRRADDRDDGRRRRRRRRTHRRAGRRDLPRAVESRRRGRSDGRRRPARPLARRPAGALELTTRQIAAQLPTTVRGSAIPASTPSGSTTIAWAWPNPLS